MLVIIYNTDCFIFTVNIAFFQEDLSFITAIGEDPKDQTDVACSRTKRRGSASTSHVRKVAVVARPGSALWQTAMKRKKKSKTREFCFYASEFFHYICIIFSKVFVLIHTVFLQFELFSLILPF